MIDKLRTYIASFLFICLTVTFFMTIWAHYSLNNLMYYNDELNLSPHSCNTVYPYDSYPRNKFVGLLNIKINKIISDSKHTRLFGKVIFDTGSPYSNNILNDQSKLTLNLERPYRHNISVPIKQYVDLHIVNKNRDNLIWESQEIEIFNVYGNNFSFPLGNQFLAFEMNLEYWDEVNSKYQSIDNFIEVVNLELPKEYETFSANGKDMFKERMSKVFEFNHDIKEEIHVCVIKVSGWLKWLVMFLMIFLITSILLIIDRKSKFSSVDLLALLLSVFTIRSILLGDIYDTSIYALDGLFLACLYLVMLFAIWPNISISIKKLSKRYEKLIPPFLR